MREKNVLCRLKSLEKKICNLRKVQMIQYYLILDMSGFVVYAQKRQQ